MHVNEGLRTHTEGLRLKLGQKSRGERDRSEREVFEVRERFFVEREWEK